jgi:transposase
MHDAMELPEQWSELKEARMYEYGYLPMVAAYCRRLGLVEVVDTAVQSQMQVQPGLVVQAMVLDVLSGRTPLYRLEVFLARQDVELLLGEAVDAHAFNDNTLTRSLDAIFQAGTGRIVTELGRRAASLFQLDMSAISYDTTSTSVWGEYRESSEEGQDGPYVTYGHSKDEQPHLKQFMTELLCVDRGVPIFGKTLDGNSSDKTSNHEMLTRISSLLAQHGLGPGAFIYVADSAMVTEQNLTAMESNRFISRLPATYDACREAIGQAMAAQAWTDLGSLNEAPASKTRPPAEYKAFETSVTLYGVPYRAVVIHSSSHDKRRQKKLERQIAQSIAGIAKNLKQVAQQYFCEADALAAAAHIEKFTTGLHRVIPTITSIEVRPRGRPAKDKPARMETRYRLSWEIVAKTEGIEKERESAGCFVMLTNVPDSGEGALDSAGILRTYKGQYGVESDFAFLKDPLVVNDLFLKTPARIDALGMVLIVALMIYRLMERSMRLHLQQNKLTVQGWDNKPTDKPTTFMLAAVFLGVHVLVLKKQRFFLSSPNARHMAFLASLGLDSMVFLDPNGKCTPIIPLKSGAQG